MDVASVNPRIDNLIEDRGNMFLFSVLSTVYERSGETELHVERLNLLCQTMGHELKMSMNRLEELKLLCMFHDIGKVGIDNRILKKGTRLEDNESHILMSHSVIGYNIAKGVPELQPIASYILNHHERWVGKGYPQGQSGEDIPLLSRIFALADAYEELTEEYAKGEAHLTKDELEEIRRNAGLKFDPFLTNVFTERVVSIIV